MSNIRIMVFGGHVKPLKTREKAYPDSPRVTVSQTAHISLRELSMPTDKKLDIVNPVAIISYLNVNKSEKAGNKTLSVAEWISLAADQVGVLVVVYPPQPSWSFKLLWVACPAGDQLNS